MLRGHSLRQAQGRLCPRKAGRGIGAKREQSRRVQAIRIRDPTDSAGSDPCDSISNPVAVAKFLSAVSKQSDKSLVDVAEAEQTEIISMDSDPLPQIGSA